MLKDMMLVRLAEVGAEMDQLEPILDALHEKDLDSLTVFQQEAHFAVLTRLSNYWNELLRDQVQLEQIVKD